VKLLLELLTDGIVQAGLFAMLALGFGLVLRTLRIFHLAYGAHFVAVSYLLYTLSGPCGLPLWEAVLLSIAGGALLGCAMEVGLYRPFYRRGSSAGAVLIASLGLSIIVENTIALFFGNEIKTISRGVAQTVRLGPVILAEIQLLQLAVGCLVVAGCWVLTKRTRFFKAAWAIGDEPELVPVLGLPLFRLRGAVMAFSGVCVAIPACLIGIDVGMDPHMGMSYLLVAAVAVIAGGVHSFGGWITGATVLAVLRSLAVWRFSAQWVDLVTFAFLIAVLLLRPQGVIGERRRIEEGT
jgi:branched-chain amino acid transport system permease protein